MKSSNSASGMALNNSTKPMLRFLLLQLRHTKIDRQVDVTTTGLLVAHTHRGGLFVNIAQHHKYHSICF
jgi:hypothetical protein